MSRKTITPTLQRLDHRVRYKANTVAGFSFVLPGISILFVFLLLPALAAFVFSFTDFDIYALADIRNARFVGVSNYRKLMEHPLFGKALVNTFYFVAVAGPLSLFTSLVAALMLRSRWTKFPSFFRTMWFLPVVTTLIPVALVWRYFCHPRDGLFNQILATFSLEPVDWLGSTTWAMAMIILLAVWKNFGFNMVICVAGLNTIPDELYEAARLDGAGTWRCFRSITLPMLAPTFLFLAVTTSAGYLQLFSEPYVMTQGGPLHSTYSVVLMMYEEGFRWWNMGFASAIAVILFGIVLAVTSLQFFAYRGVE